MIVSHIVLLQVSKNTFLFKENDQGHYFYIVKSGEFELDLQKQDSTKIFRHGDTFGELALIQKNRRTGSVKCTKDGEVYCLEGNIFREIVQKINANDLKERIYFLNIIPLFKGLTTVQLNNLATSMIKCEFREKHTIITEGDQGDSIYIIKEGTVICMKNHSEIRKLHPKDYFGESSILFETKRSLSIISEGSCVCYHVSKAVLMEALGSDYKQTLLIGISKDSFLQNKTMKCLIFDDYFARMFPAFQLYMYKNGDTVMSSGPDKKKKIIIVIQGNLVKVLLI